MKHSRTVLAGAVLLGACSTTTQQRVIGPVPVAPGSAAEFAAVVPPSTGSAHCEVRESDLHVDGGRVISLVQVEPVERRISVILDGEGAPTVYIDARGDLSSTEDEAGDRTTIGLYLDGGYAVVGNQSPGRQAEILEIPLEEAMDAQNLGMPGQTLERVLARCGSGDRRSE